MDPALIAVYVIAPVGAAYILFNMLKPKQSSALENASGKAPGTVLFPNSGGKRTRKSKKGRKINI